MGELDIRWLDDRAKQVALEEDYFYYDQYCIHPQHASKGLAFKMIVILSKKWFDEKGLYNIFGTVVSSPISNENSHKVLQGTGMEKVADIYEEYDKIGKIVSTLYYIDSRCYFEED